MSFCSDKFGYCVSKRRVWAYVEDGERVLTIVHAAGGKDHGDEVDAGVF